MVAMNDSGARKIGVTRYAWLPDQFSPTHSIKERSLRAPLLNFLWGLLLGVKAIRTLFPMSIHPIWRPAFRAGLQFIARVLRSRVRHADTRSVIFHKDAGAF